MSRCVWFGMILSLCLQAKAQISDSLCKALPDTLRPRNKVVVTDKEKFNIILNSSQAFVQHHYSELGEWTRQLEKKIDQVQPKEEKIPYAQAIAGFYLQTGAITMAFDWNKKLVAWGAQSQSYRPAITNAYLNLSLYYSTKLRQDSAVAMLHQAQNIATADHDSTSIRDIYYLYMSIYANLFLYHQALDNLNHYVSALPPAEKWKDTYTNTMLTKAAIYGRLYSLEKKEMYADSVKKIVSTVMNIKKAEAPIWYHTCYNTLGYLSYHQKDYKQAVAYFDLSLLPKYNRVGSSVSELNYRALLYRNICLILLGDGDVIQKSLAINVPPNDFTTRKALNEAVYQYYAERNDYKNALYHYSQSKIYADSLDVIGQRGRVFEAEQKYSVAQKEADIAILETKNLQAQAKQDRIMVTGIILLLLLALLVALLYLRSKRQQAQRLVERQKLTDELQVMEHEMELERLSQQAEKEAAITGERKTISENMHDEVSSSLAALRYLIADIRQQAQSTETKQALTEVEDEAKTVYLQSREFMHRLYNDRIGQTYNVVDLLDNLSLRFGESSGLQVAVTADADMIQKHFSTQQHAELYRVIKEAVANSMKHSGAKRIEIRVYTEGDQFYFDIEDDGRGLQQQEDSGLGLATMQQRIAALKGQLQINSGAQGLHLSGSFPMIAN